MKKLPLQPVPSQSLKVKLEGQNCELRIYYRFGSTYLDLISNGTQVVTGAICRDGAYIINIAQSAFEGNLFFMDMLGNSDPDYHGFGERWRLFYRPVDEL